MPPLTAAQVTDNPNLPPNRAARRRAAAAQAAAQATAPVETTPVVHAAPVLETQAAPAEVYVGVEDNDTGAYDNENYTDEVADDAPAEPPTIATRQTDAPWRELVDELRRENAELRRTLQEQTAPPKETPAERKARLKFEQVTDDPSKELEDFLKDDAPLMRRFVEHVVSQRLAPIVQQIEDLFSQVDGQLDRVSGLSATAAQRAFEDALKLKYPNYKAMIKTPPFEAYLKEQAPLMPRGVTVHAVAVKAWEERDVDLTLEIFDRFTARSKPAANPAAAGSGRPAADSFIQPGTSRGAVPPAPRRVPNALRQSDWDALRLKHRRGDIPRSEFDQKSAAFRKAAAEGRLVNDVAASPANAN